MCHYWKYMANEKKKKTAKRKYEEQQKMDAYRNTVHLEDKREEFGNSHKLER